MIHHHSSSTPFTIHKLHLDGCYYTNLRYIHIPSIYRGGGNVPPSTDPDMTKKSPTMNTPSIPGEQQ